ncbi:Predicted arabinose efflux permease, MFS family [Plantibacter sp. VKM Ac-1784]|uniref:Predicted arabinose efflux permease, MFS family n=1 Tax=Plantibacter elymi (nom. nud.) TaxID=199708 RepID=A0ABY1RDY1_9MICO|nr:MFS transporter [Plantibacter sp. VKM Ac-1784]SMQ71230.1 Predicted arabinose efflux permease, MFS family [Plantibacter sp. VKM Ac-1784]
MLRVYLWSRGISWTGNALTAVALPLMLFQLTGSAALAGLLAAVEAVPYLVLGLPVGALVDRWSPRSTLTGSSVISALATASVPMAAIFDAVTPAHLVLVGLTTSIAFVFFDAASFGAIPAIVGRTGIAAATARMMTVSTLIGIAGPPLGGLIAATTGGPAVLLIDAASYLVGALLLSRIAVLDGRPESDGAARGRLRDGILEGLRYIRSVPIIRDLTLLGIGNSLAGGAVSGLLIVAAVRTLGLDTDSPAIGVLFGASAVGALASSWLIGRLQRRIRTGVITAAGLVLSALGIAGWSVAGSFALGCATLVAWQIGTTTVSLNGIIVRQTLTPAGLQGRVNTTARMIAWGGQPLGAGAAGLLADTIDVSTALLIAAAVALLTAIIAMTLPTFRSPPLPTLST